MITVINTKKSAFEILKGNWISAIFSSMAVIFSYLITYLIIILLSLFLPNYALYLALLLLCLFLNLPLTLGLIKYYFVLSEGLSQHPNVIFYYFSGAKRYLKAIGLFLRMFLKASPMIIAFYLPVFVIWIISNEFAFEMLDIAPPLWTSNLGYILSGLKIAGTLATLFYLVRYYMSPMLLVADDSMDYLEALNMSNVISKKTGLDYISLCFGFFGWFLLSLFVMPLIFTVPYFGMSYIIHCKSAIDEYNIYVDKTLQAEFPTFTAGAFYDE